MDERSARGPTGEARTDPLLRREAARRVSTSGTGGSPPAVEATLASISAEVTAEAVERLERAAMPRGPKARAGG